MSAISDGLFTPRTKDAITDIVSQKAGVVKCTNDGMDTLGFCNRIRIQWNNMEEWKRIEQKPSFQRWIKDNEARYFVCTGSSWLWSSPVFTDVYAPRKKADDILKHFGAEGVKFRDLREEGEPVLVSANQVLSETQ